jgi:hypothetical protein
MAIPDPYDLIGDAGGLIGRGFEYATGAISDALWYVDPRSNEDTSLSQSRYDFAYKVFPNDLGMDYLGHYMVININVPVYPGSNLARGSAPIRNQFDVLDNEFSKVDVLRFGNVNSGGASSGTGLPRRTRRIAQSIALYMPGSQIIYNGKNSYEEISLTALGGQMVSGIVSIGSGLLYGLLTNNIGAGGDTASGVGNILNATGQVINAGAQVAGFPINPRVEVLFATTPLRDFQFEFLMVPRNEQESIAIREIVRTLRFHSAPEIDVSTFGNTFIPPAEFDITFYHRGVENLSIPRINTCVLLECEVDYAPGLGIWQTYRDGTPLATRLRLIFKEVEQIHKLRVLQGF